MRTLDSNLLRMITGGQAFSDSERALSDQARRDCFADPNLNDLGMLKPFFCLGQGTQAVMDQRLRTQNLAAMQNQFLVNSMMRMAAPPQPARHFRRP
jgi:hypothetical protein